MCSRLHLRLQNSCKAPAISSRHDAGRNSMRIISQEIEVRSLNHPYSLKTKSSQCHYVEMTRSEHKFQAPLNRRYREVLAKTEHLTIKTMSTGHARHG